MSETYPPELFKKRREQYVKQIKIKKGCPLAILTFLATLLLAYIAGLG